ncbi:MAG: polysaccharide biosynthesis protein PslF [Nocardioidaceae bacterium]|jgi:glycosyltransferase involved in cell wall biosynthesis|nr:polysaccharide biosynthesis protein PslF [Nocardioidaceae bacterium]
MTALSDKRLVYVAPRFGASGVGDYADDFIAAVRPHVRDVVEVRFGPPRGDRWIDIWRHRREVRRAVADAGADNTIVHCEMSGGSLAAFWATKGVRASTLSATLHDPPRPIWFPYLTRLIGRSAHVSYGLHRPLDPSSAWLERRAMRPFVLFALSTPGVEILERERMGAARHLSHLIIPERAPITPVIDRPRAVGLFGHVYRGKGFGALEEFRAALDPAIAIRVAGRGTEELDPIAGVEILGEVNGPDEDAFFASISALLLPYEHRFVYGHPVAPASSVLARAMAYATPAVCSNVGEFGIIAAEGGCLAVDGGGRELATAAQALLADDDRLRAAAAGVVAYRETQTVDAAIAPYLAAWS